MIDGYTLKLRETLADICDEEIQSDNPSCYTLADAIIKVLPELQGDWQPIDTAPVDGSRFDAWAVHPECDTMGVRFTDVYMRGDKTGYGFIIHTKSGVQWEYLESSDGVFPAWKLTHWMSQPTPPKGY